MQPVQHPPARRLARAVSRQLNAAGLHECITWAFVDPRRLAAMGWTDPAALVAIRNPQSVERSVLRPSLAPGVLEVLATNTTRQMPDVRVFEVGHVFAPHRPEDGDHPAHEERWLALGLTGLRAPRAWHAGRERVDVYDAKGLAELALAAAGVSGVQAVPWPAGRTPAYLEPARAIRLVRGDTELGWCGEVALAVREAFDLPAPVFLAELSLSAVAALPVTPFRVEPLPRFPPVQRDLALVVPPEVTAAAVEAAIRALRVPWLTTVELFDVYEGNQVGSGRRSLAFGLTFQAPDRTLTDAEVNEQHARLVSALAAQLGAEVRGA
jgi:phenylalanyl-tRNA synthetase beta chain